MANAVPAWRLLKSAGSMSAVARGAVRDVEYVLTRAVTRRSRATPADALTATSPRIAPATAR
jgi:hypothetical protein